MTTDEQRVEFEEWARKQGCDTLMLQCDEAGDYVYKWVHGASLAWREKDKRHAEQLAALKDLLADADKWAEVHRAEKMELLLEIVALKEPEIDLARMREVFDKTAERY